MKNYIKELYIKLSAKIVTLVKFCIEDYRLIIVAILACASGFFVFGSVGAYELENIETTQCILQLIIGALLVAVLILYIKYQAEKEEKEELLEELEEEHNKKANPMKIVELAEKGREKL